jgi:lipoate-protein ligase B
MGVIPYQQAWELQEALAVEIAAGRRDPTLLLLQHPPTYTFGSRGQSENLLWDEAELERRGVSVHWVDRGGDVTYHGPGQLVGYPLLPLGKVNYNPQNGQVCLPQADYVGYLRKLEEVLILALADLAVETFRVAGLTGVWVSHDDSTINRTDPQSTNSNQQSSILKIASIGVKVDAKGVSRHGFALNVDPDMSYWEGIIACGLHDYEETSLAELLDPTPPLGAVMDKIIGSFGQVFGYLMVENASSINGGDMGLQSKNS